MQPNTNEKKSVFLEDVFNMEMLKEGQWISKKSAVLVFHGVGNQKPFETLDTFARGMINTFKKSGFSADDLRLEHKFAKRDNGKGGSWYDNFIRVTYKESENYLDFYEFYWAPETEDKVSLLNIQEWVHDLASGAKKFYEDQKYIGQTHNDESFFFDKETGFRAGRYRKFIKIVGMFLPTMMFFIEKILAFFLYIPIIGGFIYDTAQSIKKSSTQDLNNIIGDVVAYNSPDPKNKFFSIRRSIQKRAFEAIKYLIEPTKNDNDTPLYQYEKVIIAAHSLGTQIAFDGLNSLNRRINLNDIKGLDAEGNFTNNEGKQKHISELLSGFVTFGSHLDKAAFFFREHNEKGTYLKQQILENFYCFKQKKWDSNTPELKLHSPIKRYLDTIKWRNYYDGNDPVSGHLDYYKDVININCNFTKKAKNESAENRNIIKSYISHLRPFTHSYYWREEKMYGDIIVNYLI